MILEKQEQTQSQNKEEITKIEQKLVKLGHLKKTPQVKELKSQFFQRINKADKPLGNLARKKEKTQSSAISYDKVKIITDTAEIQKISN